MSNRPSKHAHHLVLGVAQGMAQGVYDALMQKDAWYDLWKRQNPGLGPKALEARFVAKNSGRLLPAARATLAGMLGQPGDEAGKEIILEALLLDNSLLRGRAH